MTKEDKNLMDIVAGGQSGKYNSFVRYYAGKVRRVVQMKNPLDGSILVSDIDRVFEIINPALKNEVEWFKGLQSAVKLWCNEKVIANRILGLKNDNEYDMRVFEKVVLEKFFMQLKGKAPKHDTIVETDFKTMVELVEMGARRFG